MRPIYFCVTVLGPIVFTAAFGTSGRADDAVPPEALEKIRAAAPDKAPASPAHRPIRNSFERVLTARVKRTTTAVTISPVINTLIR